MFRRRSGVFLIISTSVLLDSALLGQLAPGEEPVRSSGQTPTGADRFGDPLPAGARARLGTVRLRHPGGGPVALVFCRDGRSLFSARDKVIRQWNVATGKELRRFPENEDLVSTLALSPDESVLAAGCETGISLWEVKAGKRLRHLEVLRVRSLAFSGDGQTLLSGAEDGKQAVRVWDVATGRERFHVSCPLLRVSLVAYTRNGRYLIAASSIEKQVCLADAATGAAIHGYHLASWEGEAVAVAPDGQTLAISERLWRGGDLNKPAASLLDLATGRPLRRFLGHESPVQSLVFSADGSMLASAAYDRTIRFWDPATGRELRRLSAGDQAIIRPVFSPDGRTLAGTSYGASIRLWEVATGRELLASRGHEGQVSGVALSPDGKCLATCSYSEHQVRLWDRETGELLHVLSGHEGYVRAVAFLPDGKHLISGSGDSTLRLWDAVTGKELRRFVLHEPGSNKKQQVLTMGLSSNGQQVLACSTGFRPERDPITLTAWDTSTGKCLFRREDKQALGFAGFHAVAPDGQTIAVYEQAGLVLRDAATGKEIQMPNVRHRGSYPSIFSTDGKLYVAHSPRQGAVGKPSFPQQGSLWVYSLVSRKEIISFPASDTIRTLAISPDNKTVATSEQVHRILLWELASGQERGSLEGHEGPVDALIFSADGRFLVSGSEDATALVWELAASEGQGPVGAVNAAEQGNAFWTQLGDADARKAYRAIWALVAAPKRSVPLLKGHLQPVAAPDAKQVAQLLADLDDNRFAVRRKASTELQKLGELAEPALRKVLADKPPLEVQQRVKQLLDKLDAPVTNLDTLRALRAIEVLEHIGNPEASQVLHKLAGGAPEARVTQESQASLDRLAKRPFPRP